MVNRRAQSVTCDLALDSISYLLSFSILVIFLNFRPTSSDNSPCGATLAATRAFSTAKFPSFVAFWRVVLLMLLTTNFSQACSYESCAEEFTKGVKERKVHFGSNLVTCLLLRDYNLCLNASSNSCRGDLRYKVLQQIASRYYDVDFECKDIIEKYEIENRNVVLPTVTMPPVTTQNDQCLFPYKHMNAAERSGGDRNSAESDFRFCSAFGDPHIRTFGGLHDTCKIADAWPLLDNAFLNIQIVSAPIADGFEATAITKISIIIKALPGCTEQKTYTVTQDSLPSYFDDGTIHSGEPSTSNGDSFAYPYRDGTDTRKRRAPPVLFIETLRPGYHIRLQLRYASTRVVVRRSGERSSLSVAVKMPEEALAQESFMSPWQLCLSSCSPGEKVNYTEALKNPTRYFESLADKQLSPIGRPPSFMARDVAAAVCRAARLADFFFDACVFDLMVSGGDASYRDAARDALDDIRSMYPVYGRHYETNRSDLAPYLAPATVEKAATPSVVFSRTSNNHMNHAAKIFRTFFVCSILLFLGQL